MKEDASKRRQKLVIYTGPFRRAVKRIANDWIAYRCEMRADLMRTASVQLRADQSEVAKPQEHTPSGSRFPASLQPRSHTRTAVWIACDGKLNAARILRELSVHERDIGFANTAVLELRSEQAMRCIISRNDYNSGCASIQAVHNARAYCAPFFRKAPQTMQQRIHHCSVPRASPRVHDHSRRLIYDHKISVFVQDLDRNVFRFGGKRRARQDFDLKDFAGFHVVGSARGLAGDANASFFNQLLDARAA
jgi:hypothetical protein